jgi:hypothetical protein
MSANQQWLELEPYYQINHEGKEMNAGTIFAASREDHDKDREEERESRKAERQLLVGAFFVALLGAFLLGTRLGVNPLCIW